MNDSFDKHSIYDIFKNLSGFKYGCGFHCFYFGLNDILRIPSKFTIRNFQNRNIALEEILHTASIVFNLARVTLTYVSLRKNYLIIKEIVKSLYLNPTDSNLLPINSTQISKTDQMCELIGFQFRGIKSDTSSFVLDCSLNDDLEDLFEYLKNVVRKIIPDSKHIFFCSLLNQKEMQKLESKNDDFINSFHNPNYNIPIEMISRTNSKTRYDFWSGFRTSINIPSDDYPFIDTEFQDWVWCLDIDSNLNHSSLIENIDPEIYCRNYNAKQNFLIGKKGGKIEVVFDEEYVNAYDFDSFIALDNTDSFVYIL